MWFFLSRHHVYIRASLSPTDWKCVCMRVWVCVSVCECVWVCVSVCVRENIKEGLEIKNDVLPFLVWAPGGKRGTQFQSLELCVKRSCGKIARRKCKYVFVMGDERRRMPFLLGTCFMKKVGLVKVFLSLSKAVYGQYKIQFLRLIQVANVLVPCGLLIRSF